MYRRGRRRATPSIACAPTGGFLLQNGQILNVLQEVVVTPHTGCQQFRRLYVLLQLLHVSLHLGPSVLEPSDHLSVAEAKGEGNLVPIGGGQILLVEEALLQLEDLGVGERGAGLAFLFGVGGGSVVEEGEMVDVNFACEQKKEGVLGKFVVGQVCGEES